MPFIKGDRDQTALLGYSLSDFVDSGAKCRFVLSLVGRLDLSSLYARYSRQGAEAFDPSMMVALWFYAYCEGITSTRKLEERCLRDTHFIYLSANLKPDHTSFSRFRKNHLDLMGAYFVDLVRMAVEEEVSDFALLAVDGTRIQAAASAKHIKDEDGLGRYLKAVRADLEAYMQECAQMEKVEGQQCSEAELERSQADIKRAQAKIERARAEEARLLECQAELTARKAQMKAEYRSGHTINLSEPEACALDKVNGTSRLPAYNAQVVVDAKTHLITACDAVQDRNDPAASAGRPCTSGPRRHLAPIRVAASSPTRATTVSTNWPISNASRSMPSSPTQPPTSDQSEAARPRSTAGSEKAASPGAISPMIRRLIATDVRPARS